MIRLLSARTVYVLEYILLLYTQLSTTTTLHGMKDVSNMLDGLSLKMKICYLLFRAG